MTRPRSLVLAALVFACGGPSEPALEKYARISWIEASWDGPALSLRVVGVADCAALTSIETTITIDTLNDWTDLVLRPRSRRSAAEACVSASIDTTVVLGKPAITGDVVVWATFPWEPGVRRFLRTFSAAFGREVGGAGRADTTADGCVTFGPDRSSDAPLRYAVAPEMLGGDLGEHLRRDAFASGDIDLFRTGCGGLEVLRVRQVQFGVY